MTTNTTDPHAWVGRTEVSADIASRTALVQLAALLDRPLPEDDAVLSPTGHWLQFTPRDPQSALGADGHPRLGGFLSPLDLPRRMWAGSTIDYAAPIRPGQKLQRTTTIESITPKTGASGRLCFVVLRHDIAADGIHALTDRHTIVYREAAPRDPAAGSARRPPRPPTPTPDGWDWAELVAPDEVMLFRFSALTFNAHRIHYDLAYVTEVEGYPGLVIHGPLTATLLVSAFQKHRPAARIARFDFRAHAPVFAGEQLHLVGRAANEGAEELAVIAPGGHTAISAEIAFR